MLKGSVLFLSNIKLENILVLLFSPVLLCALYFTIYEDRKSQVNQVTPVVHVVHVEHTQKE